MPSDSSSWNEHDNDIHRLLLMFALVYNDLILLYSIKHFFTAIL